MLLGEETQDNRDTKKLFFFSHRSHTDRFNGTSVYDNELLQTLEREFYVDFVEPDYGSRDITRRSDLNFKSFVSLLYRVYIKQLKWVFTTLKYKNFRKKEKIVMLVEDIYSSPLPLLISYAFGIKIIYRSADFGKTYYNTLSINNRVFKFIYPPARRVLEHFVIKKAAIVVCPSRKMKEEIVQKYPNAESKVVVLPYIKKNLKLVTDLTSISVRVPISKVNIVLLGDFRYPPNLLAGRFVLNEVVQKLRSDRDSFNVQIVGPASNLLFMSSHKSVKILGPVKDLDDLLLNSHIGLAATTTVGGLSMKIVDYLVNGLRVVSTKEAAAGIVPNSQMKVVPLSDFSKTIDEEISDLRSNGFNRYISQEVIEEYMSDEWVNTLIVKMKEL